MSVPEYLLERAERERVCLDACPLPDDCDPTDPRCPIRDNTTAKQATGKLGKPRDWDGMRRAWNEEHGTDYAGPKEFLAGVYAQMSMRDMAQALGVANGSLHYQFRRLGIPTRPRGRKITPPEPTAKQRRWQALRRSDIRRMTRTEIELATGYAKTSICALCRESGLRYRGYRSKNKNRKAMSE
jgi:hypothetical protein